MHKLSNTERLIADLENAERLGHESVHFMTGKFTGNGQSVVAALTRRGFDVTRSGSGYLLRRGIVKA